MNNWFNFKIPFFNEKFGNDWLNFKSIVDSNVDNVMNKTFDLYKINDISTKPLRALELSLQLRGIPSDASESLGIKRKRLRSYNKDFKSKGMKDTYLDYQESVVGVRGEIYNGYIVGSFIWGISNWHVEGETENTDRVWSTDGTRFNIYIDCKTTDSDLLDELADVYRQNFLLPAFYKIYLVDSDFTILRTV